MNIGNKGILSSNPIFGDCLKVGKFSILPASKVEAEQFQGQRFLDIVQ